ncbi:MAG: hypothetical protein V8S95_10930 [Odoribacter sp.]
MEIRNAENLEALVSGEIFGSLTGMSGGFMLGTDRPTEEESILPFDMKSDGKSTVTADFYTFGYPPDSGNDTESGGVCRTWRWEEVQFYL